MSPGSTRLPCYSGLSLQDTSPQWLRVQHVFCDLWSLFCRTVQTQIHSSCPPSGLRMGKKLCSELFLQLLSVVSCSMHSAACGFVPVGMSLLFTLRVPRPPVPFHWSSSSACSTQLKQACVCQPRKTALFWHDVDSNHKDCSTAVWFVFLENQRNTGLTGLLLLPQAPLAPAGGQGFYRGIFPAPC